MKKICFRFVISFILVICQLSLITGPFSFIKPAYADQPHWYNSSWSYRKPIVISGAMTPGSTQTNFPVYVELISNTDLKSANVQSDADDILFTSSDGTTKLDHEIETFSNSSTDGTLKAWVRIPSLPNGSDTMIFIYYGNSGASSQQNKNGVWNSAFKGVWHFPDGSSLTVNDSTSNGNNGTNTNNTATSGQLDGAASNPGTNTSEVIVSSPSGLYDHTTTTYSAWINVTSLTNSDSDADLYLFTFGGKQFGLKSGGALATTVATSGSYRVSQSTNTVSTGAWHHVAASYTTADNKFKIYLDGSEVSYSTQTAGSGTSDTDTCFSIGDACLNNYNGNFYGKLDEVKISNVVRSADWITTEYNNQSNPSVYLRIGGQEQLVSLNSWKYKKQITINKTMVANTTQYAFPVYITESSDTSLKNGALSTGNDILFTDADGSTKLPHEIEKFSSSTGEIEAWVQVPTLSTSQSTVIYMYYGNSGASDQSNKNAVWDNNFLMVQHLGNGSTLSATDSTSNANNGSISGPTAGVGQMDGAGAWSASTTDKITVTGQMGSPARITLSGWAKISVDTNKELLSLGDNVALRANQPGGSPSVVAAFYFNGSTWVQINSSINILSNGWHYLVYTVDPGASSEILYVDGTSNVSGSASTAISYAANGTNTFIGNHGNGQAYGLGSSGFADEVRISNSIRSADWVATEYNNENAPGTYITISGASSGNFFDLFD